MADGIVVRILGDDSDLAKTLDSSLVNVAKWGAAAATAAAVASIAITKSTATTAREIKNLSRLIGTSTTDFQKMAAGAKTVGIEQDKLADIFKDVNDKVGDFMQTGAGPLVDFFENIAPKVGITADEFKNLSGPEAMQKYVDGLEAANVSQSEMTFYMEAIASDASLLTPLLRANGAGFKEIGKQAEEAGAILSEIDISKLQQLDLALIAGEQSTQGLTNEIATKLAPQLTAIIESFNGIGEEVGGFEEIVTESFNVIVNAAGYVGNTFRGFEVIFRTLQASAAMSFAGIADILSLFSDDFENIAASLHEGVDEATAKIHETLQKKLPIDALKEWIKANEDASVEVAEKAAEANEAKNEADIIQIDTELMRQSEKFNTLLEIEQAYQEASKEGLDAFNANNLKTAEDYAAATEALEEASSKRKLGLASSMFGNLATLMDTESKKQFKIGKVAALSQAVIDGYSSVLSSYKEGTKIGGPVVGAAFAATAAVATGVQISKIKGASFDGGGGGGGGMASSAPNIPEQQSQAPAAQEQNRSLVISGIDQGSLYSGEQLLQLMDNINGAVEDGYTLKAS